MLDELFGEEAPKRNGTEIRAALEKAARERILILDGAMGTQIQGLGYDEDHFRGDRQITSLTFSSIAQSTRRVDSSSSTRMASQPAGTTRCEAFTPRRA